MKFTIKEKRVPTGYPSKFNTVFYIKADDCDNNCYYTKDVGCTTIMRKYGVPVMVGYSKTKLAAQRYAQELQNGNAPFNPLDWTMVKT